VSLLYLLQTNLTHVLVHKYTSLFLSKQKYIRENNLKEYGVLRNKCLYLVCNNLEVCYFCSAIFNGGGGGEGMVWEEAALSMSCFIIRDFSLPPRSG
jgi:hypothetical protein